MNDLLAVASRQELRRRVEHPVAREHLALVGEVDRRQLELLGAHVLPDVELGPVAQREHAHVLAARGRGRCRGPTAPAAGGAGPTARSRRGTRTRAPWPGPAPRRGGRRRTRRRSRAPRSRRAAWWSAAGCGSARRARGRGRSTPARSPRARRARGGRGTREPRGSCGPVSTCMTGNGTSPGRNALRARCSSTIESLPPENSSTGFSSSAATSRMTWIASASSWSRWCIRPRTRPRRAGPRTGPSSSSR